VNFQFEGRNRRGRDRSYQQEDHHHGRSSKGQRKGKTWLPSSDEAERKDMAAIFRGSGKERHGSTWLDPHRNQSESYKSSIKSKERKRRRRWTEINERVKPPRRQGFDP